MESSPVPAATGQQSPAISVTELFTIGIGPSSSHTVGPMRAAFDFARSLREDNIVPARIKCDLYGSLSLTGRGHGTDGAVILGLAGETPEGVDPDRVAVIVAGIRTSGPLPLGGRAPIDFDEAR